MRRDVFPEESPTYGMDLRDEFIRLAGDNRASGRPLPRFRIFPVFPKPGKGRNAITGRRICLLRDRNVVEPGELFFRCVSTGSGRTSFKADKNSRRRKRCAGECESRSREERFLIRDSAGKVSNHGVV
jgi:hypothetical protein